MGVAEGLEVVERAGVAVAAVEEEVDEGAEEVEVGETDFDEPDKLVVLKMGRVVVGNVEVGVPLPEVEEAAAAPEVIVPAFITHALF